MIKEIGIDDIELIRELEYNFSFVLKNVTNDLKSNPFSHYVVFIDNQNILGYINYYLMYEKAEIANFNVLENYQNKGIGTKLIDYVINLLNGCGSGVILLIALYYFIKYIGEQERLNSEERTQTHQRFCETIEKISRSRDNNNDE